MSSLIERLTERRAQIWDEAKALSKRAADANRAFTDSEQARWVELNTELDALDTRRSDLVAAEKRSQTIADDFAALLGRPADLGAGRIVTPEEKELTRAFRAAIKSRHADPIEVPISTTRNWYQPGVERRDLLKTTATQAMPVSVYGRIVEHMVENSAILRAGATLVQTSTGEDLQVPKSTGFSTSAITAEGSPLPESDPTLAVVTLKAYKYGSYFQVSHELANDGNPDLVGFLARQAGQSLALAYGPHLVTGDGSSKPRGVLTDATAGVTAPTGVTTGYGSVTTAGQGLDLLVNLHSSLAEPYAIAGSRAWLMANGTLGKARALKDSAGRPILPIDIDGMYGAPFVVDPNMPAMAASAEAVAYGDFSRYFVRVAEGIRFERSDDYAFTSDLVTFRAIIRLDGALVDASAIKTLTMAAS